METRSANSSARTAIFESIRANLSASKELNEKEKLLAHGHAQAPLTQEPPPEPQAIFDKTTLVGLFKDNLESVDGHCIVASNESEVAQAITDIIQDLRERNFSVAKIALSDSLEVERLMHLTGIRFAEVEITPSAADVFGFDIGISRVQAGIAETGTLLLDSSRERHRLVSLVPPVHIAILDASQIVATLGEALSMLRQDELVSPIVTLVTGPSRTADIELTLAIGVHGPQELFVIIRA